MAKIHRYEGSLYSTWLTEATWAPNDPGFDLEDEELAGSTAEGTLELWMHNGNHYIYLDVPAWIWSGLVVADSPGRFFNNQVKDQYTYAAV